jgi:uncharacterized protein (TIGR02284 family)
MQVLRLFAKEKLMTIDTKEVRSILNDLIQTCKDGQQGFLDAAHHVSDANVKSTFLDLSQQHSMFAGDLQQEVTRLQGEPEKTGSTTGALHRGWIDFKAKVSGQNDQAAIREAERGEDAAIKAYQKALEKTLPADLRVTLELQLQAIVDAHRRVRVLEARTSGGAA